MKNKSFKVYDEPAVNNASLHEQLLNSLPVLVFVTDKNDRILYVNKNFSEAIGHVPSAKNLSMKELVNRADWNTWNENLFKLSSQADGASCVFNIRFNNGDAGIRYLKIEGKVLKRDEHLKPVLYFFTGEDITDDFRNENTYAEAANTSLARNIFKIVACYKVVIFIIINYKNFYTIHHD